LQGPTGNVYDKYGTGNPLARLVVNRFLAAVDEAVDENRPNSVLDTGCGEGFVTERLAQRLPQAHVVGVDVADPRLHAEWRRREGRNLSFREASVYSVPYPDNSFELVCALEVLEHLERPREALSELARVASRTLLLSVPLEPLWRFLNILSGRYTLALGNTPGHVNHWSRRGFVRFCREAGELGRVRNPLPWTMVTVAMIRHG
jgi:2-polyprenyl-3-methyl-5-hydroxy-6-metoxy-1,4-benzoquinol methylase